MTVFPNIEVIRIDTKESVQQRDPTPETFIQDVSQDITPDFIEERLGKGGILIYTLRVEALHETTAKGKARSFVRAKNPTEPDAINIINFEEQDATGPLNTYTVVLGVGK